MNLPDQFLPPKRRGLIFHIGVLLMLAGAGGFLMWLSVEQEAGSYFVLFLLASILLFIPLPFILYRGYALIQARYVLDRDGLRLRWGLRAEDIPIPEIEWVRPASELAMELPLPRLRTPGAIIGHRWVEDLGPVEFFATDEELMVLVATPTKIYVISPEDSRNFLALFSRIIEMGSPSPLTSYSALPAVFLRNVWSDRLARVPLASGIILTLALFIMVGVLIPGQAAVPLGFDRLGEPLTPGPPERLLLLPVLGLFTLVFDILAGLFFYRRPGMQAIAYLLWVSSSITPILLIAATTFLT